MAEVLITLGIIGVVAALTISSLINKINDKQFKVGYKKSYSDFSQVFEDALNNNDFIAQESNTFDYVAAEIAWNAIKSRFKVVKECNDPRSMLNICWVDNRNNTWTGYPTNSSSRAFIDASGRVWVQKVTGSSIYFVDINGSKGPNIFGKDRFTFVFADEKGSMLQSGMPAKIMPGWNSDVTNQNAYCNKPPCYYHSWLFE